MYIHMILTIFLLPTEYIYCIFFLYESNFLQLNYRDTWSEMTSDIQK